MFEYYAWSSDCVVTIKMYTALAKKQFTETLLLYAIWGCEFLESSSLTLQSFLQWRVPVFQEKVLSWREKSNQYAVYF